MTIREECFTAVFMIVALVASTDRAFAKDQPNTHELVAKVVAVDLQGKSIQTDVGTGQPQTLRVAGEAAEHLDQLPVGRMFKLTIQDNDDPAKQVVIAIKRARNTAKS